MRGPPLIRPTWRCPNCGEPSWNEDFSRIALIHNQFPSVCDPERRLHALLEWEAYYANELSYIRRAMEE